MISDDTNIIIPMSSDVIMLCEDTIEQLCQRVAKKKVVFAELVNLKVSDAAYKNFDDFANPILNNWESMIVNSEKPLHISRRIPTAWLFFLGAIYKEDILSIGYRKNSCDAVLWQKMAQQNFDGELLTNARAVHQYHSRHDVSCGIENSCNFYCSRTSANGRWKGSAPKIKPFNIIK
jgi:hypothetical protein